MKIFKFYLIALLFCVVGTSKAAIANALGSCTTQQMQLTSGTDTQECTLASYCEVCVDCCTVASVQQMAQEAFKNYRKDFIMDSFYKCPIETDFEKLTDDLRNTYLFKIAAIGAFIDSSILNNTLRDLQVSTAQTLQSYAPSEQICRFGTISKSLAASEAKMNLDKLVLSEVGLSRNLGTAGSISAGRGKDNEARLYAIFEKYCDLTDNKSGMSGFCDVANPVTDVRQNRDVDFTRLLDHGVTINADMTDANDTHDETSVVTLGHFLYGHAQPIKRISETELKNGSGSDELYREYRSVFSKRAVAQNTYNTLAAMKMAGSGGSDQYIHAILKQIGLSAGDEVRYLGAENTEHPSVQGSYNAQMNLLTKQIYQDSSFYANLMESKTNVKRSSAALQGIGLMQGRDIYKSIARSEMLMALLVEMEARKMVNNVQGPRSE